MATIIAIEEEVEADGRVILHLPPMTQQYE
jgi:hypothetical protein